MLQITTDTLSKLPNNPQKSKINQIFWVFGLMLLFTFLFVAGWLLLTKLL